MVIPASCNGSDRPGTPTHSSPQAARTGSLFDIKRFSSHDGPGIRSTVFLTGCPLRCAWCHNPEAFAAGENQTRQISVPSLIHELERDIPYYDPSGGGITISGGEPLVQSEFVFDLLRACRKRDLHTALDTCGLVAPDLIREAADLTDLFLYDLKAMDSNVHRQWTGAPNGRILDNLGLLHDLGAKAWIRFPVIPGINDHADNIDAMIRFLTSTRFRRISLLPYHRIADGKYHRLGLPDRMAGINPPSTERMKEIQARFQTEGFDAHIGS